RRPHAPRRRRGRSFRDRMAAAVRNGESKILSVAVRDRHRRRGRAHWTGEPLRRRRQGDRDRAWRVREAGAATAHPRALHQIRAQHLAARGGPDLRRFARARVHGLLRPRRRRGRRRAAREAPPQLQAAVAVLTMKDFTGRAALVTGGSRGVGRAIALELAARGADVAIVYKSRRESADEVAAAIATHGVKTLALPADVGDSHAVAAAFARACEAFGGIDILAHSAGAPVAWKPVREQDPRSWAEFVRSDLIGAFNVVHAAVGHMHARGRGVIIAISSIAAQMCQSRNSQGAAAKAGVEALIRVVAREEGRYGIRANVISI